MPHTLPDPRGPLCSVPSPEHPAPWLGSAPAVSRGSQGGCGWLHAPRGLDQAAPSHASTTPRSYLLQAPADVAQHGQHVLRGHHACAEGTVSTAVATRRSTPDPQTPACAPAAPPPYAAHRPAVLPTGSAPPRPPHLSMTHEVGPAEPRASPHSPCSPTSAISRCCSFSLGLLREMCQAPWRPRPCRGSTPSTRARSCSPRCRRNTS